MTDYPFQIALLIQKSIVGVLTGEERKQLEQWLAEDDEHKRMYQELVRPGFLEEARREHHQFQVGEGYRRFAYRETLDSGGCHGGIGDRGCAGFFVPYGG